MNCRMRVHAAPRREAAPNTAPTGPFGVLGVPFGRTDPWLLRSTKGQVMQSLQVEGQADQAPLAGRCPLAAQGELPEAQHFLDDPDHWLDGHLPGGINRLA